MIPPRILLAATDFSEESRSAVVFAACLSKQCHAAFHLLHAEDPLLAAAARQAGIDLNRDSREALETFIASAMPATDEMPIQHVMCGPAAEVIVNVAAREHADLIVVGSRGMSGAEHLLFGSTTEGVLRHARTSVLVVPPNWEPAHTDAPDLSGIGPVVAAADFSPPSMEAAAAAACLADALGTSLEVVHVVPVLPVPERWRTHADVVLTQRIDIARAELATAVQSFGSAVTIRTRVESGHVAASLAECAAWSGERRPILVLGRRPGRLGAPPGAIAYRALTLAAAPVLVYVPPA